MVGCVCFGGFNEVGGGILLVYDEDCVLGEFFIEEDFVELLWEMVVVVFVWEVIYFFVILVFVFLGGVWGMLLFIEMFILNFWKCIDFLF